MRLFGGLVVLAWLAAGISNDAAAQSFYFDAGGIGFGYSDDHHGHHNHDPWHPGYDDYYGHHGHDPHGHHRGDYSFGLHLSPGYDYHDEPDYYSDDYNYRRAYDYPRSEATKVVKTPPVPSAAQLARMSQEDLQRFLRVATQRLGDELDDLKNGDGWRLYLQLETLTSLSDRDFDASDVEQLFQIAADFDATAGKPEYEMIASLWGFRAVHVTLNELLISPVTRQRTQLAETTQWLGRSLMKWKTGESWKTYLYLASLDELLAADGQNDDATEAALWDALPAILDRFDKVSENASYKMIADLPAFRATHGVLAAYYDSLAEAAAPLEPPLPPEPPQATTTN